MVYFPAIKIHRQPAICAHNGRSRRELALFPGTLRSLVLHTATAACNQFLDCPTMRERCFGRSKEGDQSSVRLVRVTSAPTRMGYREQVAAVKKRRMEFTERVTERDTESPTELLDAA